MRGRESVNTTCTALVVLIMIVSDGWCDDLFGLGLDLGQHHLHRLGGPPHRDCDLDDLGLDLVLVNTTCF